MTWQDRFDRLLGAMAKGEAPSARKSKAAGQSSGAEPSAFYGRHWQHDVRLVSSDALHSLQDASTDEWTDEASDDDGDDWRAEMIHLGI